MQGKGVQIKNLCYKNAYQEKTINMDSRCIEKFTMKVPKKSGGTRGGLQIRHSQL